MTETGRMAEKAEIKQRDRRACLFFDSEKRSCPIGMENCILEGPQEKSDSDSSGESLRFPCRCCPYGQGERPCVSFCMKKVLREWQAKKDNSGKEGADDA